MEYIKLGSTGLDVSRICLGCMSFGEPARGSHPWSCPRTTARPIVRQALEAGINFFDTANVYSAGTSEEIVGQAAGRALARATRSSWPPRSTAACTAGPNGAGLSRKAIMAEIDHSLRRLGTDYVDLYQIHRFDPATPIEETLEALHDVVQGGQGPLHRRLVDVRLAVRQDAPCLADVHGWTRFVSMQDHYNLLYREEEREMLPLCADQGDRRHPLEPAGPGRAHPRLGRARPSGAETDEFGQILYTRPTARWWRRWPRWPGAGAAPGRRWRWPGCCAKPAVTAPIVGVTNPYQLDEALAALDVELGPDEIAELEEPYRPARRRRSRLPGRAARRRRPGDRSPACCPTPPTPPPSPPAASHRVPPPPARLRVGPGRLDPAHRRVARPAVGRHRRGRRLGRPPATRHRGAGGRGRAVPAALADDPAAPPVLFVRGDPAVARRPPAVAVVGHPPGHPLRPRRGGPARGRPSPSGWWWSPGVAPGIEGAAHDGGGGGPADRPAGRRHRRWAWWPGVWTARTTPVASGCGRRPHGRGPCSRPPPSARPCPAGGWPSVRRLLAALADVVVVVECHAGGRPWRWPSRRRPGRPGGRGPRLGAQPGLGGRQRPAGRRRASWCGTWPTCWWRWGWPGRATGRTAAAGGRSGEGGPAAPARPAAGGRCCGVRWIVDGMNLIGSRPDGWWRDRPGARRRLVGRARPASRWRRANWSRSSSTGARGRPRRLTPRRRGSRSPSPPGVRTRPTG